MTDNRPIAGKVENRVAGLGQQRSAETNGCELIRAERIRQITKEGWTPEHDDNHGCDDLAFVASDLLRGRPDRWGLYLKHKGNRVRLLTIAGALVAAEIDRELRAQAMTQK
jgi:hypothetical protein